MAKKIAIIAIHGVGDHLPCASARSVADLLGRLGGREGHSFYPGFREATYHLPIRKTLTTDRLKSVSQDRKWGPMDALAASAMKKKNNASAPAAAGVDHLFMEAQLAEFDDTREGPYSCLRVEGARAGGSAPMVHVHDMCWSDLSGVANGFARIFYELYQLLFHLTSIGLHNLSAAAIELEANQSGTAAWNALRKLYLCASAALAWPIALFNLLLVAFVPGILAVSQLRAHIGSPSAEFYVVDTVYVFAAIGALSVFLPKLRLNLAMLVAGFVVPVAAGLLAALIQRSPPSPEWSECLLAGLLLVAFIVLDVIIVNAYESRRPGSRRAAAVCFVVFLLTLFWFRNSLTLDRAKDCWAIVASLNAIELILRLLKVSWTILTLLLVAIFVLAPIACRLVKEQAQDRVRRTLWTAVLTAVLPTAIFLVVTLTVWAGFKTVVVPLLPPANSSVKAPSDSKPPTSIPPLDYRRVFPQKGSDSKSDQSVARWASDELGNSGVALLPFLLGAILGSLLIVAWALFPSIRDELLPPEPPESAVPEASQRLGNWLTQGYRFTAVAGMLLGVGLLAFLLLEPIARLAELRGSFSKLAGLDQTLVWDKALGGAVAGIGAGLLAFGGRLSKLALGFRPLLRTLLDVDDWFREHPTDSNPTGRICARYVSLLRHICRSDAEDRQVYDALIIVAHSQGTVITADLLRFLHAEHEGALAAGQVYDPDLASILSGRLPVYLFTMGCPLRQLYGLRFPFLYGWAYHERAARTKSDSHISPGTDATPLGVRKCDSHIPSETAPDSMSLGVRKWVNAFRSGDYIGRHLWRLDDSSDLWDPRVKETDRADLREDFCIGVGAHTHYWDATAPSVGERLDDLILEISGLGR
jgi:hypothetical protein